MDTQMTAARKQSRNYYHMVDKRKKEGEYKWQELKQQEQQEQDIKKY